MRLRVLSPRGEIENTSEASASKRLHSLEGRRIGILNNGKPGGEMLLPYLEDALKKQIQDVRLRTWLVPLADPTSVKEPLLHEIAGYADGVVVLIGD